MDAAFIEQLLVNYKKGTVTLEDTLDTLKKAPFEDLGFAKVDHHRGLRKGFPEVIYCPGKTPIQVRDIMQSLLAFNDNLLATRADRELFEFLAPQFDNLTYNPDARLIYFKKDIQLKTNKVIMILCAGTADIPVVEEAAVTAEFLGNPVSRIYDIGIAGLHRLLAHLPQINKANVIIAVAGMEGALPGVVASLVNIPVIAVPTSVGYGTHFNGLTPLFSMLNSCVTGMTVMNIDNGFGAGCFASMINK